jgi:hypothetical protein
MPEDLTLEADPSPGGRRTWWDSHRLRYNLGLLIAGLLGFIAYVVAVDRCIDLHAPGDWEITLFTSAFQGVGYLVAVAVANLFYGLGAWSERIFHPSDVKRYRTITFGMGFWFSVLVPLIPSVLLFFFCSVHAGANK